MGELAHRVGHGKSSGSEALGRWDLGTIVAAWGLFYDDDQMVNSSAFQQLLLFDGRCIRPKIILACRCDA